VKFFWWWQKVGTGDTSTFAAFSQAIRCASVFVLPGPNYPCTRVHICTWRVSSSYDWRAQGGAAIVRGHFLDTVSGMRFPLSLRIFVGHHW